MKESTNLAGHILISQPKCEDPYFSKGVVIVGKHGPQGSWGLMVNKPASNITLDNITRSVGIMCNKQDKVYTGGPVDTTRVYILHSLDWQTSSTIDITSDIGITGDMSILAAISQNQGPALFRACIGMASWGPGQLDAEFKGEAPWKSQNRWLDAPATIEAVFNLNEDEQWQRCIEIVAHNKIASWL
jgi:putative transcriptional regulator